jgi:hypothetical protein
MMVGMEEPRPSRKVAWIIAAILSAIVLYVLSVGPAAVIAVHTGEPLLKALPIVYWPLVAFEETIGDESLEHYGDWCIRHTGGDPRYNQ